MSEVPEVHVVDKTVLPMMKNLKEPRTTRIGSSQWKHKRTDSDGEGSASKFGENLSGCRDYAPDHFGY